MTQNDKQALVAGKCIVGRYFARLKAVKRINELLKEAEQILTIHPAIEFNNFFENELLKTNSIILAEQTWSLKVNNVLAELFGIQSDISQQFSCTLVKNELSKYAGIRKQIVRKREVLSILKDELVALNIFKYCY